MMALDALNNLDTWPLPGMDGFLTQCAARSVSEVNLTGTNTDPLLFVHIKELVATLKSGLGPLTKVGIRTNGALVMTRQRDWRLFDKASISLHSFDTAIYRKMMGSGHPPQLKQIVEASGGIDLKVNIVLGPENIEGRDILKTLNQIEAAGIRKVNLREPYGQPRIGDPMAAWRFEPKGWRLGMPFYHYASLDVMYWDVHYVEVESVNLYASGLVSETYPITKGHDPVAGNVLGQEHFAESGRQHPQWTGVGQ